MDINDNLNFPDPGIFQRMIYRGPSVKRYFEKKRRVLSVREPVSTSNLASPTPGPSNETAPPVFPPPVIPPPEMEMPRHEQEVSPVFNDGFGYFSEDDEADKGLLIRFALRCEILF